MRSRLGILCLLLYQILLDCLTGCQSGAGCIYASVHAAVTIIAKERMCRRCVSTCCRCQQANTNETHCCAAYHIHMWAHARSHTLCHVLHCLLCCSPAWLI